MNAPLNQAHTTSATEGCVDQGSRPPASRHILRALSTLSSRIGAVMVALMLFGAVGVAVPVSAAIFAQFTDVTSGTLNGVGFTVTTIDDASYIERASLKYDGSVTTEARFFNGMKVTFASEMEYVELHLKSWRGPFGFEEYTFSKPFTVIDGLANSTVNGNQITAEGEYINGVIRFIGAIDRLRSPPPPATGFSIAFRAFRYRRALTPNARMKASTGPPPRPKQAGPAPWMARPTNTPTFMY